MIPFQSAREDDEEDIAGVPLGVPQSGMTAVASNVESLDGAPLVQYLDGDPLDVDGSPLGAGGDEEDLEGVPLDMG